MKKSILNFILLSGLSIGAIANDRFIRDDSKDIVVDTTTNLMWQDNSDASDTNSKKTWQSAISYCENLTLGGYNDWHLPNFNELYYLANKDKYNPAIDDGFKYVVRSYYWSSTTFASNTSYAWYISFGSGYSYDKPKTGSEYVRCVRLADN